MWRVGFCLTLWGGTARAQTLDAHGEVPPPAGASASPMTVWAPLRSEGGSWSAGFLAEYADEPAVLVASDGPDEVVRSALLDDVVGINVGGLYVPHERVGVGVTLPVFVHWEDSAGATTRPSLGDLQVWVPVGLLGAGAADGFAASVIPYVDLPTGAAAEWLGSGNLRAGGLLTTGLRLGPASVVLDGGVEGGPTVNALGTLAGGWDARFGGALGVVAGPLAIHVEAHGARDLDAAARTPVEALLTADLRFGAGPVVRGGGGRGVTSAPGAAAGRGYLGFAWTHSPEGQEDVAPELRGVVPELVVVNAKGEPVANAIVRVDGTEVGRTDADGRFASDELKWRRGVTVEAPGLVTATVSPPQEGEAGKVALAWRPTVVPVRVTDQEGRKVASEVVAIGEDGRRVPWENGNLVLEPGAWLVEVRSDGDGRQTRTVVVDRPGAVLSEVDVVVRPIGGQAVVVASVADADGAPVSDARLLVDGLPVGSTSTGGDARIDGLSPGSHTLEVRHDAFTAHSAKDLALRVGENAVSVRLDRVPGSVRVLVRGPAGQFVEDATVRFDGPVRLAPAAVGPRGERVAVLSPGAWRVFVLSPSYGSQVRAFEVSDATHKLLDVEVVLQPAEEGAAELTLSVVDPDGAAVEGVDVSLDGRAYGATTGGSMEIANLGPGVRRLVLSSPHTRPHPGEEIGLDAGMQAHVSVVEWKAGTVRVDVRGAQGPVTDASVRFVGPARLDPRPVGSSGSLVTEVGPGRWNVIVFTSTGGLQQRTVDVPVDGRHLQRVEVVFGAVGGLATLALQVVDPDGEPVSGAEVSLDDEPLGATSNMGGMTAESLPVGLRTLNVSSSLFAPYTGKVKLVAGVQDQKVKLSWASGVIRVSARGLAGPAADAVVRALGPTPMAAMPVDSFGERLLPLTPGRWMLVALSPSAGAARATVDVTGSATPQVVELDLTQAASGVARLLLRVVDDSGGAVQGAWVTLAGSRVGDTAIGGALMLDDLDPGPVNLVVESEGYDAVTVDFKLLEGAQERVVELKARPGTIGVEVVDEAGAAVDAEVRFTGPTDRAAEQTGADGRLEVSLQPGRWNVVASTAALGPSRSELVVQSGGRGSVKLVLAASKVEMGHGTVSIKEEIRFDFGKDTLRGDADPVLGQVANMLIAHPDLTKIVVEGHTDNVGDLAYNHALSQRRAESVVRALVARGVAKELLVARGYGAQRPVAENVDEAGRALNRRVAFVVENN